MINKWFLSYILVLLLGFLCLSTSVVVKPLLAAPIQLTTGSNSPIQVALSPANAYVQMSAGETKLVAYQLINHSQQTLSVSMEAVSFTANGVSGEPQLLSYLDYPGVIKMYASEQSLEPLERVVLLPQSQQTVYVRLTPARGMALREYPMTLLFHFYDASVALSTADIHMTLGSNLILRLAGESNLSATAAALATTALPTTPPLPQFSGQLLLQPPDLPRYRDSFFSPRSFAVLAVNEGAFSSLIDGELVLRRSDGSQVASWPLQADLVLGKSSRLVRAQVSSGAVNAESQAVLTLPPFLLGSYVLEGKLTGEEQGSGSFQVHFVALPFVFLGVILISVPILAVVAAKLKTRAQLRRLKQKYS